jgi:hypothetical protein
MLHRKKMGAEDMSNDKKKPAYSGSIEVELEPDDV